MPLNTVSPNTQVKSPNSGFEVAKVKVTSEIKTKQTI